MKITDIKRDISLKVPRHHRSGDVTPEEQCAAVNKMEQTGMLEHFSFDTSRTYDENIQDLQNLSKSWISLDLEDYNRFSDAAGEDAICAQFNCVDQGVHYKALGARGAPEQTTTIFWSGK